MSLTRKTAWSAVSALSGAIGRFASGIILARMLGPAGLGKLAYLVWLVEISNVITNFGLYNSITRFLAELHGQNRNELASAFARWAFIRYSYLSLLGSVVLSIIFYKSTLYNTSKDLMIPIVLLFFAQGFASINSAELTGRQRYDILSRINIASSVLLICGQIVGSYYFGIRGALFGYISGALVPSILSFTLLFRRNACQFDEPALRKRAWTYAVNTWLVAIVSSFIWSRMEIFFLERYCGDNEVAMFTIGLTLSSFAVQGPQLFMGAFMPHFAELFGAHNIDQIKKTYVSGTRLIALMLFPLSFGMAASMPLLLTQIYGNGFSEAIPTCIVLLILSSLGFAGIGSCLLYAFERSRFMAIGGIIGAQLSIVLCLLIIPHYGAFGAAIARVIVQSSMIILATWYIVCKLGFDFPFTALWRAAVASLCCSLMLWTVIKSTSNVYCLTVVVFSVILTYLLSIKVLKMLHPDDAKYLKKIMQNMPPQLGYPIVSLVTWLEAKA